MRDPWSYPKLDSLVNFLFRCTDRIYRKSQQQNTKYILALLTEKPMCYSRPPGPYRAITIVTSKFSTTVQGFVEIGLKWQRNAFTGLDNTLAVLKQASLAPINSTKGEPNRRQANI